VPFLVAELLCAAAADGLAACRETSHVCVSPEKGRAAHERSILEQAERANLRSNRGSGEPVAVKPISGTANQSMNELKIRWRDLYDTEPPPRAIAYRQQEQVFGNRGGCRISRELLTRRRVTKRGRFHPMSKVGSK